MSESKVRLLAFAYFVLAVGLRFAVHGSNITAFVALAIFAGCYLSAFEGVVLGLGAMALTDTIGHWLNLGNLGFYHRPTMVAVYLATALPAVLGWLMTKFELKWPNVFASATAGAATFFLITNFAAWLDPMMDYAQTPLGLATCYYYALPFAYNHFLSTLIFSTAFFGGYALLNKRALAPVRVS